jgi:hypothetical protein
MSAPVERTAPVVPRTLAEAAPAAMEAAP